MKRLNNATLAQLDPAVQIPGYDRRAISPGILHLGLGAFHRAHQAVYTDRAIERSGGDWGIVGVSMRSSKVAAQLNPQDGLYSVMSEDQHGQDLRVIGSIERVLVAPEAPEALDNVLADPAIRVVTLTITEKGYCLGEDGWSLDRQASLVQHDLAHPETPGSAIGILAKGLALRHQNGGAPLTLLSCDNLGENSKRLRAVLIDYMASNFPKAVSWLEHEVAFPCSMVDRIVPAMTEAGLQRQSTMLGLQDASAVATEPFSQWIIENHFATDIPDWCAAGAQLVDDIRPFEEIKLRLLNASHTAIAISGLLAGKDTVAEVMTDPRLAEPIKKLMSDELIPALEAPAGFDLSNYSKQLLDRFSNPCLQHKCTQIAADSTEKIRQRWLNTLRQQADETQLLQALANWCFLVLKTDVPLDDPRAEPLLAVRAGREPDSTGLSSALGCLGIGKDHTILSEYQRERLLVLYERMASQS